MRLKKKTSSLSSFVYIENCYLDFFLLLKQFRWRKKKGMKKRTREEGFFILLELSQMLSNRIYPLA